jgi:cytosine/adenosine deaminase-related metal-dependent hydrolase
MVPYALDPATLQETASNAITKLKSAGVTTVIFAGDPIAPRDFTQEATAQDYFPEWFLNLSVLIDTNVFSRTYDQEQWKHAFGLSALFSFVMAFDAVSCNVAGSSAYGTISASSTPSAARSSRYRRAFSADSSLVSM